MANARARCVFPAAKRDGPSRPAGCTPRRPGAIVAPAYRRPCSRQPAPARSNVAPWTDAARITIQPEPCRSYFASGSGRIWNLIDLARRALAGLHVERRARADGRPQPLALPARLGIVDPAVHPFRVEAGRIRHAEHDPLAVLQRQQALGRVAGVDRRVRAQPGGVELIDPGVVAALGASGSVTPLSCGSGSA